MRFIYLSLILLSCSFSSVAQDSCPEFDDLIKQADSLFKKEGDYRNALYKYNSAKTCSPSRRKEVDDKINELLEEMNRQRIKAIEGEDKVKKANAELVASKKREIEMQAKVLEIQSKDSSEFAENFIKKNKKLLDTTLSKPERKKLLEHVEYLRRNGMGSLSNSVAASLKLLHEAKLDSEDFFYYLQHNLETTADPNFFVNKSKAIDESGYVSYDTYYYWALTKTDQAMNLLPEVSKEIYEPSIQKVSDSLKAHRKLLEQNYWMPDTVIDLPYKRQKMFALPTADYQSFVWGVIKVPEEYKRIQLRFLNLSVNDFSFSTDSLFELVLKGKYYSVLATDANYRYMVVKRVDYSLKKNLVEVVSSSDTYPAEIKLIDRKGNVLSDLYSGDFFFSPDAKFLANWKAGSAELNLFDLKTLKNWKFPASSPVYTMSFSTDSKTMLYFNDSTKLFYSLDLTSNEPRQTSSFSPMTAGITNIDFTGGNKFLKINTRDSVFLYDIGLKKIIFQFDSSFVKNIVVAPNGKEALLICNRKKYGYYGCFTYCVSMDMKIKDKLYSDCDNFFYTPDGKFIVGYDDYDVMRWSVDKSNQAKGNFRTCLGFKELIDKGGVPFNYFLTISDADQLELGARKLYDIGSDKKPDTLLSNLYYRQSQLLFDRLKIGDAQNIRQDRVPFFYDWSNYIRRALGNRDFYDQFSTQQVAVEIFDKLINSPDGKYPMLLYYAANGNMLLNNLYDSLNAFNLNFLARVKNEIGIREKVFAIDPDNSDNIYYFKKAFEQFSVVSDTLGWRFLKNKKYFDRLILYRDGEKYLAEKLNFLPDSVGIKEAYINALSQLAPSYLYTYANRPGENIHALDSVTYFADKGLSLSTNDYDIAIFKMIKARAHLLRENELDKALDLYDQVVKKIPAYKKTILTQLTMLKEAGAVSANISKAEEFINKQ